MYFIWIVVLLFGFTCNRNFIIIITVIVYCFYSCILRKEIVIIRTFPSWVSVDTREYNICFFTLYNEMKWLMVLPRMMIIPMHRMNMIFVFCVNEQMKKIEEKWEKGLIYEWNDHHIDCIAKCNFNGISPECAGIYWMWTWVQRWIDHT